MPYKNQKALNKFQHDSSSYFHQYLNKFKICSNSKLKQSDSMETFPCNSDRSYKSRCSSIDDIVTYSMKPENQIEQQLYDELRRDGKTGGGSSGIGCGPDEVDMVNNSNITVPPVTPRSTVSPSTRSNGKNSIVHLPVKLTKKPNKKPIYSNTTTNNSNNSNNNNNSNKHNSPVRKINVAGRGIGRPPDTNIIKSKSAIFKRRRDYSKIISIRNRKIMSHTKITTDVSHEIHSDTSNNHSDVVDVKAAANKKFTKFKHSTDLRRRSGRIGGKIISLEKLNKDLKYLRDRHLNDMMLANEIRKMTL